ncbi:MAG: PAS domain-containing sensor histidine kinase [Minisyncoccota bacterium]
MAFFTRKNKTGSTDSGIKHDTVVELLRKSEAGMRGAQKLAHMGSWYLDVTGNNLIWTDEVYRIFEVPLGKPLTYEEFLETVHPDDREYVDRRWNAALRGEPYNIEHRIVIGNTVKWVREIAEITHDKTGAACWGVGTVQDITKQKKIAIALHESEEKFHAIFERALDGILLADAATKKFGVSNPIICKMLGYTDKELSGLSVQDIHPAENLLYVLAQFEKQLRGETELASNIPVKRKDGSIFYADIRSSRVIFGGKEYLLGIFRDVTERRSAERNLLMKSEELAEINKYLKNEKAKDDALLDGLGEGIIATDRDGRITVMNHAVEEILGWKSKELLGKVGVEVTTAISPDGQAVNHKKREVNIAMSTGSTFTSDENEYIRKDGTRVPLAVTVNPIIFEGGVVGSIGVFRDITKERELEETRRDLLSLASHQLRTPLSGTKWLIETLKKGLHGPLTEKQGEYLDEIYKINERMTALVHDMMNVLRAESGAIMIKREPVSMTTVLDAVRETLNEAAKYKNITLQIISEKDYVIETDSLLLRSILESFVSNAINYSSPGKKITISVEKKPTEFILSVQDFGIGIPEDEQQRIFERFYRASNAKVFDTRGTGLGLYMANTIAQKIGVRLSFESRKDMGSTFYIHIPRQTQESLPQNVARV